MKCSTAAERLSLPLIGWGCYTVMSVPTRFLAQSNLCHTPTHAVDTSPPDGIIAVHVPRTSYENNAGVMPYERRASRHYIFCFSVYLPALIQGGIYSVEWKDDM